MRTKVQKWGNSLAVRIPKPFAQDTGLAADTIVDLVVRDHSVVVTPVGRQPSLAALLRKVTARNLHEEVETGERVGRETW
jgi:antitoxin MazE